MFAYSLKDLNIIVVLCIANSLVKCQCSVKINVHTIYQLGTCHFLTKPLSTFSDCNQASLCCNLLSPGSWNHKMHVIYAASGTNPMCINTAQCQQSLYLDGAEKMWISFKITQTGAVCFPVVLSVPVPAIVQLTSDVFLFTPSFPSVLPVVTDHSCSSGF